MRLTSDANYSKWSGKTWNVIGDSITEKNFRSNLNYHDYVAQKIGCKVNNYGSSGTGWRTPSAYSGFSNAIHQRIGSLATADLITVFAGTNDWGRVGKDMVLGAFGDTSAATSFYGAVDQVLNTLRTNFPTQTIAVFTPLERSDAWYNLGHTSTAPAWAASTVKSANNFVKPTVNNGFVYVCTTSGTASGSEPTWPTTIGATVTDGTVVWTCFGPLTSTVSLQDVSTAIIKVANKYSVPVLDLYNNGGTLAPWNTTNNNTYFSYPGSGGVGDGLHPNDLGHQILADKILAFLNTL